jgi:hypothetical protein
VGLNRRVQNGRPAQRRTNLCQASRRVRQTSQNRGKRRSMAAQRAPSPDKADPSPRQASLQCVEQTLRRQWIETQRRVPPASQPSSGDQSAPRPAPPPTRTPGRNPRAVEQPRPPARHNANRETAGLRTGHDNTPAARQRRDPHHGQNHRPPSHALPASTTTRALTGVHPPMGADAVADQTL